MSDKEKEILFQKVEKALDEVRPHLKVDGGNIELIEITDRLGVKLKWLGNCEFCNMSIMTMKAGVEQTIRNRVPEITTIEAVNGMTVDE